MFGSALRFGSYFLFAVLTFLMNPYMVAKLGKQDCGLWVTASAIVGVYSMLELGLNTAVSRFIAAAIGRRDDEETNRYFNAGIVLFSIVGAIIFLLLCLTVLFAGKVVPLIRPRAELDNLHLFTIVLMLVGSRFAIELPQRVFNGILTGCMRQDIAALVRTVFGLVNFFVNFLILYFSDALLPCFSNLLIPLAGAGLFIAVGNGIIYYFAAKSVFPPLRFSFRLVNRESLKRIFSYTTFSFVAMLGDMAKNAAPVLIIGFLLNQIAVTQFGMVISTLTAALGSLVQQVTNIVSPLFSRLFAQKDFDAARTAFFFSTKVAITVATFVSFGLVAWSDPFILRWMGPAIVLDAPSNGCYHPVTGNLLVPGSVHANVYLLPTLFLMVFASFIDRIQSPGTEALYGTSNHHYYSLINGIEAFLIVIVMFFSISHWGFLGVGIGFFFPVLLTRCILLPIVVCRVLGISRRRYADAILFPFAGCLAACLLPNILTPYLVGPTLPKLFLTGAVSFVLYLPVAVLLVFTPEERRKVWRAAFHRHG